MQPLERPDGIPGSRLSGPWPVGEYASALRDRLRAFKRVQVFGEVFGLKLGRAKVWFELRDGHGALPCSMWRKDWDALGLESLGDGSVVVAAGGCDFYPGSRASSPSFSFAVTKLRVAGEGDLLAQVERLRRALADEGLFEPQKRLPRPSLPRSSASSRARAAKRATTCSPACGGAAGPGGSCGRSHRCRTATPRPRSRARCRTWRPAWRSR